MKYQPSSPSVWLAGDTHNNQADGLPTPLTSPNALQSGLPLRQALQTGLFFLLYQPYFSSVDKFIPVSLRTIWNHRDKYRLPHQWRLTGQEKGGGPSTYAIHLWGLPALTKQTPYTYLGSFALVLPSHLVFLSLRYLPHFTNSVWHPHTSGLSVHDVVLWDTRWNSSYSVFPELLYLLGRSSQPHCELLNRRDLICFSVCTLCFDQPSSPINRSKYLNLSLKVYCTEIKWSKDITILFCSWKSQGIDLSR